MHGLKDTTRPGKGQGDDRPSEDAIQTRSRPPQIGDSDEGQQGLLLRTCHFGIFGSGGPWPAEKTLRAESLLMRRPWAGHLKRGT